MTTPSVEQGNPSQQAPGSIPAFVPGPTTNTQEQQAPPAVVDPTLGTPAAPAAGVTIDTPAADPANIEAEQEGTAFRYAETGDAALDVALDFIGNLGFGPDDLAVRQAGEGKFELLEAKLEALGDKAKGYQRFVALAKDAFTRTTNAATERTKAITTAVTEVATGFGVEWGKVQTWAASVATPEEKAAVNSMLTSGTVQASAAAKMLCELYAKSAGAVVNPASAVTLDANGSTPVTNGALSPREYATEVQKLAGQIGSFNLNGSPEYQALQRRRAAYRG